jgi:aminoglycoside 6'-N-acetyltransferase
MKLSFRCLQREDFALLSQWFSRPHVEPWWREEHDPGSVERKYGPAVDGTDPTQLFVVEQDGGPIGFAQLYRLDDNPGWEQALAAAGAFDGAAGIDYLIGEEVAVGRGLGPEMIGGLVEMAWQCYPAAVEVVASVQQGNRRSWRALEKAGFERAWAGDIESDDPTDNGPSYVYVRRRPQPGQTIAGQATGGQNTVS